MTITSWPPMPATEWYMAVARGQIPGATVQNVYGYQAVVGTTTIPLWENATTYTYPTGPTTMTLYSSSAADTAVSIIIIGLDASYNRQVETLVLTNGTVGVPTVNQYTRINSIFVNGSNNPAGVIYLSNAAKTVTYAQINLTGAQSDGRSQMSIFTVPNGHTFYLTRVNALSTPTNNVQRYFNYRVWTRNITTGIITILQQAPFVQNYQTTRVAPRPYPGKTDIQWQVGASADTGAVSVAVEGILIQGA
jgi:hypothetical protein